MKKIQKKHIKYLTAIVILSFVFLKACTFSGKSLSGNVRNADTNSPLKDVFVILRWTGFSSSIFDGRTVCYHIDVVKTDSNGNFTNESWWKLDKGAWGISEGDIQVSSYLSGYVQNALDGNLITMKKVSAGSLENIDEIFREIRASSCNGGRESRKSLVEFYSMLAYKADGYAKSKKEKQRAKLIREIISDL